MTARYERHKAKAIVGNLAENFAPSTALPPETGYECWLRYKRVPDPRLSALYASFCQRLVVPGRSEVLLSARDELVKGVGGLLGRAPEVLDVPPGDGGYIAIGTTAHTGMAEALVGSGVNPPRGDGFVLLSEQGPAVTIVGGSERGGLYGAFTLLRRLQLGLDVPDRPLVEQPEIELRMLDHWDNLDGSVERGYAGNSVFFSQGEVYLGGHRVADYARLLASVGINAIALNNVNVNVDAMALLTERHLPRLGQLANILRAFGVRLFLSVGFASPVASGGLPSADPLDADVREWWSETARTVYSFVPDLGGFLVKAGSESLPGPRDYGRDHAQGANVLADALAPFGGLLVWRCFVYDCQQDCAIAARTGPGRRTRNSCRWMGALPPTSCCRSRPARWISRCGNRLRHCLANDHPAHLRQPLRGRRRRRRPAGPVAKPGGARRHRTVLRRGGAAR